MDDDEMPPPVAMAQWFHAVDVAISEYNIESFEPSRASTPSIKRASTLKHVRTESAPAPRTSSLLVKSDTVIGVPSAPSAPSEEPGVKKKYPALWAEFSKRDTLALELAYQSSLGKNETEKVRFPIVAVNEDYLFEVDVHARTIAPVYWKGPVYEVRRAEWFMVGSGKGYQPCQEGFSQQLEEGYIKHMPWLPLEMRDDAFDLKETIEKELQAEKEKPKVEAELDDDGFEITKVEEQEDKPPIAQDVLLFPLYGEFAGQSVVYNGPYSAYLLTGAISEALYRWNPQLPTGIHLVRGWEEVQRLQKKAGTNVQVEGLAQRARIEKAKKEGKLTDADMEYLTKMEIQEDFENERSEGPIRDVDHLVLVVHGIGQKFTETVDSLSFIHSVNQLRKLLKDENTTMASFNPDDKIHKKPKKASAKNLNNPKLPEEVAPARGIQVLPIEWRKEITFGMAATDEEELQDQDVPEAHVDLGDELNPRNANDDWSTKVPTLVEITPDGVPQFRRLVSDVFLDILLYMTPKYRNEIHRVLTKELNRVYRLFIERHPSFKERGRVSIIGHSLGSVLAFDLLCAQPDALKDLDSDTSHRRIRSTDMVTGGYGDIIGNDPDAQLVPLEPLDFMTEHFFALGSPVGLFLLLKGHTLSPRESSPYLIHRRQQLKKHLSRRVRASAPSSQPLLFGGLYNIYHKSDAVAYRLEPLLTSATVSSYGAEQESVNVLSTVNTGIRPPASVPYNKGGLRGFSIGMQQVGTEIAAKTSSALDSVKAGWRASMSIFLSTREKEERRRQERLGTSDDQQVDYAKEMDGGPGYGKLRGINPTGRVDWQLQEGVLENDYLSGLTAHFSYWTDLDVAAFIMRECCRLSIQHETPL